MSLLKKLLLGLNLSIAFLLLVALFTKKDFGVEKEITINKPKSQVFAYLKSLKSQNEWSRWGRLDPNMKAEYVGKDSTVGFISKWEGNDEVGVGEQEIKKIVEGERIDFELRFKKPFESTSAAYLITKGAGENATIVKWGFSGSMDYPMNLMLLFMDMEEGIGRDFKEGLANLKAKLEK